MLKNYFQIAIKIMLRRKFFTAVSLFGISFTIMTFTCVVAMIDLLLGANPPSVNKDRTLYLLGITLSKNKVENVTQGKASYLFLKDYIKTLKTPEAVTLYTYHSFNAFENGIVKSFQVQSTDEDFWKVEKFKFIEGKPFTRKDVLEGKRLAVITKTVKEYFFGDQSPIGKDITSGKITLKIIGVVEDVPFSPDVFFSQIWTPITIYGNDLYKKELRGNVQCLILAKSNNDFPKIRKELANQMKNVRFYDKHHDEVQVTVHSIMELAKSNAGEGLFQTMAILLFLFMLLPAINLMNMNINRIYERASEIGIRKAFGATSTALVYQFVFENIIVTLLGGLIGFLFSTLAADWFVDMLNYYVPITKLPHGQFNPNWRLICYTLLACLFFGLLSGVYPAWKMSRLHSVQALKGGEI